MTTRNLLRALRLPKRSECVRVGAWPLPANAQIAQLGSARIAQIIVAFFICILLPIAGYSQGSTATITGVVRDTTGAVIPGAEITVTQIETNFHANVKSSGSGEFTLPLLPVGSYKLIVTKGGFAGYEQSGLVLQVGQMAALQIDLHPGADNQVVQVTGTAPPVESTDNTVQTVVAETTISDLPLNGRNPADLVTTVAGTTSATQYVPASTASVNPFLSDHYGLANAPTPTAISTHGVRPGGTYFSLDGADNVDPLTVVGGPFPNPDATQEFNVATGTYSARYPSAPGGAVNIIMRSGTNSIHGSVFEYIRNGYFNAENAILAKPDILKRNQFGGAAGGPILKNKLFIFGSYQATPTSNAAISSQYVPTAAERNGTFTSQSTGLPVQIPVSAVAAAYLQYIPLPNGPNGLYTIGITTRTNDGQFAIKGDLDLGQHRIFARYFYDHYSQPPTNLQDNNGFTMQVGGSANWDSLAGGDTWTSRNGKWLSEARVTYITSDSIGSSPSSANSFSPSQFAMTNVTQDPAGGAPGIVGTFTFAPTDSRTADPRKSIGFTEDVLHTVGKNDLSFGGFYRHISLDQFNSTGRNLIYAFEGNNSLSQYGLLNDNTNADFILGEAAYMVAQDGYFQSPFGSLFGIYAEDKYRPTSRLTLLAGLRWDPYLPYANEANHMDCFIPGEQSTIFTNAPTGLTYPGDPGCSSGGTTNKFNIVEPHVGFAYQVDSKNSIAIRGGWSEYSTQFPLVQFLGFSNFPWIRTYSGQYGYINLANPWASIGLADPFANGFQDSSTVLPSNTPFPSTPIAISTLDKSFHPAVVQQYTLSLQQAFSRWDSIELVYAGTHAADLSAVEDSNLPVPGPGANASNEQARRPYQAFQQIRNMVSNNTSTYNGLDLTYRHQTKAGLTVNSAFNWSKCIDESTQPAFGNAVTLHGNDPSLTRGLCDYDQNLTWRNTAVWNLPTLAKAERAIRYAFGSWTASGLLIIDAGQPFTVTNETDNSYSGTGIDYADRVPGVPLYVGGKLNYYAFTANAPGTYGNSGRNAYRAKGYKDTDFALLKTFAATERVNVMFRAEAFNLANHPNYFAITNAYNASTPQTFGTYTQAQDPRILQFSLKLLF